MMSGTERVYRFGSFVIEGNGLLYQGGELVSLPPKVAQTLFILVENHGKVVDKEFLLKSLWPDTFVEEGNLHHNVSALRKLLRSDDSAHIETIPKRGYRFVGEVSILDSSVEADQQPLATMEPPVAIEAPQPETARSRWNLYLAGVVVAILCVTLLGFVFWPRPKPVTVAKGTRSTIAVLPFSNFSSDSEADYLSDGLTDELIHALTAIPNLRVVGRTSTFQFKGKALDLRQIGAQLQASLVLEGSVQKEGNRLRVTAQLIDAGTGLHIWSQRFDRQFGDVFAIQDEICRAIARTLRANLSSPEGVAGNTQKAANLEVYTLYLRGLKEWNRRNKAGVKAGREFFEKALALDANYAPAWAGLADTLVHSGIWGIIPPGEAYPKAKAAALKAIELDGQLAEPHTTLGYIQGWHARDQTAADASFRRALELNPSHTWGRQRLASYLSVLGRHEESIQEYRQALELDPISTSANSGLALTYFWARQYDRAVEQCAKTKEIDPQFPLTYYYLAHALEQRGKYEEAIAALKEGTRLWGSTDGVMLAELYASAPGHRAEAMEALAKIGKSSELAATQPYNISLIYAALGDREMALTWLDRARRAGDVWFLYANVDPRLDKVRGDRRFRQLLDRP